MFPSVDMFVYIPLSEDTTLGDLMLKNEQLKYSTVDDLGNIEEYKQNTEYELIEQYQSEKLGTKVMVIASKVTTEMNGDSADTDCTYYYVYFTLDGMCYQVNCDGTLETVHRVLEEIDKARVENATEQQNESATDKQSVNDLLHREINDGSISIGKGEKVTFLPDSGKSYKNISIFLLGKGTVMETGDLTEDEPCCFTADVSGKYAVYSGDKNITDEIGVKISRDANEDSLHISISFLQ